MGKISQKCIIYTKFCGEVGTKAYVLDDVFPPDEPLAWFSCWVRVVLHFLT